MKTSCCSEKTDNISLRNKGYLLRVINIGLRVATLASRFLLVFFLAKLISPSDLGLYGLITASIGYALYLVGLDFYTYTTRELLHYDRQGWGGVLKNHAVLSLSLYVVVFPALTIVFMSGLLPWQFAKWFYLLIMLEHVSQELGRLLIAISDQLYASILLFLRQGTWAIVVAALMVVSPGSRDLDTLFAAWTLAGGVAIFFGFYRLHSLQVSGWKKQVDWNWILRGIKVSVPFLVATLALRGIFTIDRYWLQFLTDLDVVGAYVLFFAISSTMMAFLDAGVFSFSYPELIKAYQTNEPQIYRSKIREMLIQTTAISMTFSATSLLLLPYLLEWIGNYIFISHNHLYVWLLIAMILNAFGMIPHYALYAQNQDRPIIQSHVAGLIVFVLFTWLFSKYLPVYAVPIGLCGALACILLWKTLAYVFFTPVSFRGIRNN